MVSIKQYFCFTILWLSLLAFWLFFTLFNVYERITRGDSVDPIALIHNSAADHFKASLMSYKFPEHFWNLKKQKHKQTKKKTEKKTMTCLTLAMSNIIVLQAHQMATGNPLKMAIVEPYNHTMCKIPLLLSLSISLSISLSLPLSPPLLSLSFSLSPSLSLSLALALPIYLSAAINKASKLYDFRA